MASNLGNIHDDGDESVSFWLSKLPQEDEVRYIYKRLCFGAGEGRGDM